MHHLEAEEAFNQCLNEFLKKTCDFCRCSFFKFTKLLYQPDNY